ncbi:retrotransposon protein, putative, ty1-copia subclass, partial [Tanacetum coccineum]
RMCLYIDAEENELGDLDNEVWDLVELPPNDKTVGSKWLFNKKTDMDGVVHTYKARLVAKGYTQILGIDYEETFSPVADIRAIRILIAITTFYDYKIWQMDVKTAFLNGYLFEEVYMEQPKGYLTDAEDLIVSTGYVVHFKWRCSLIGRDAKQSIYRYYHLQKLSILLLTPQFHECACGLPSLKLSLHSCSLPGSTNAMGIETSIALVLPAREHECDTSFALGRPPALS